MSDRDHPRRWLHHQQATQRGRDIHAAKKAAEVTTIMVPSVKVDRSRITLPGLRFMGDEPHPSQDLRRTDEAETDSPGSGSRESADGPDRTSDEGVQ